MVNVSDGNLIVQADDVDIPGRGIDLAFRRTYNSQSQHTYANTDGSVMSNYGNGWTNTFDAHMSYDSALNVLSVWDIDGARYDYTSNGSGGWTPPTGQHATLAWDGACGYLWTKKNGTSYDFTAPYATCGNAQGYWGRLYEIRARNHNNWVRFDYYWTNGDASSGANLTQINAVHADGQVVQLHFSWVANAYSLLTSLVRPDGQTVTYAYDANANLTDVCAIGNGSSSAASGPCAAGQIHYQYAYNAGGHQMAWVNSANWVMSNYTFGTYQTYGYDGNGRFTGMCNNGTANPVLADGVSNGQPIQPGEGTGVQQYWCETLEYTSSQETQFTDTDHHATNWFYDSSGRVTETQEWTGAPNNLWLTAYASWDGSNNLTESVDPRGNPTDYGYDGNGNTIWVQQPQVTTSMGTGRPVARYSYDQYNNPIAYCDPQYVWTTGATSCVAGSGVTHYTWNYSDANEPHGYLTDTYTPLGYHTAISYNTSLEGGDFGLPTDVVGDSFGQLDGTTAQPQQHFTYDAYGNIVTYNKGYGNWSLSYDSVNRLLTAADPDGVTSRTCYYQNGQVRASQSAYQYALDGNVVCGSHSEQFTYDADGDELAETHHHGQTATNGVAAGVTQKWYDGADRLVEVQLPSDTATDNQIPWGTRYIYDLSQGQQVSINSPNGGGATFLAHGNLYKTENYFNQSGANQWNDVNGNEFDALDRSVARYQHTPFGALEKFSNQYDTGSSQGIPNSGLLVSKTDPLSVQTSYSYDAMGRQVGVSFSDDGGVTPSRAYTFDPDGRVASVTSSTFGTDTYTYDQDGRETQFQEGSGGSVTSPARLVYDYYPNGQRKALSINSSALTQDNEFAYDYRNDGLRTKLVVSGQSQPFFWRYDDAGRELSQSDLLTGQSSPAFQAKSLSYDAYGQLSSLTLPGNLTVQGCSTYSAQGLSYNSMQYSTDGELTQFSTDAPTQKGCAYTFVTTVEYDYDVRGEQTLVGAQSPGTDGLVLAGGNRFYYGVSCPVAVNSTSPPAMWSNPPPAPTSAFACTNKPMDPFTGTTAYSGDGAYSQQTNDEVCPARYSVSFDNDGRESDSWIHPVAKAGCSNPTARTATRTYDAENHVVQTRSFDIYSGAQSSSETYGWGPNGKLRTDVQGFQNGNTYSLHWDGDELVFVTDQNGQLAQLNFEKLGMLYGAPGQQTLILEDRDMSGVAASQRTLYGAGPVSESGWNVLNAGGLTAGKYHLPVVTDGTSDNSPGATWMTPLYDSKRGDGYAMGGGVQQGVRAYDQSTGQWMTPDAYKGDVHDPMSQRAYMWNGNNPIAYSDPSGYCLEDACVIETGVGIAAVAEAGLWAIGAAATVAGAPKVADWAKGNRSAINNGIGNALRAAGALFRNGGRTSRAQKLRIISQHGTTCSYCGRQTNPDHDPKDKRSLEIDHVNAHSDGGSNGDENKVPTCRECNLHKGTMPGSEYRAKFPQGSQTPR